MRVVCRRRGINWSLDLDEGIDLCIYLIGAYEGEILKTYTSIIKPGDVVFDIGANVGAHTLHFSRLVGDSGKIHAFEPTDYAYGKLRINLELNSDLAKRVSTQQLFFASESSSIAPESVCSSWPVNNWTPDVIRAELDEQHLGMGKSLVGASAMTADNYCALKSLQRLDLVKLDVDGNEYAVLMGFRGALAKFRPKIIIELAPFVHSNGAGDTFDAFVSFLAGLGYDFLEAKSMTPIPNNGPELRSFIGDGIGLNAFLIPQSS